MDNQDPTPRRGRAIGSAAIGAAAIVGSLLAFSGGAGAQDTPELTEPAQEAIQATPGTAVAVDGDAEGFAEMIELDEAQLAELEAEWAAFDSCLSSELGVDLDSDDDAAWEDISEEQWMAADAACESEIPEGAFIDFGGEAIMIDDIGGELSDIDFEELDAAWGAYDDCLAANGIDIDAEMDMGDVVDFEGAVFVEGVDEFSMAAFGEGDGVVTVTKVGDTIEVSSTGDVDVQDGADFELMDEEFEKAAAACEGELPEDAFFGDFDLDEAIPFTLEADETVAAG